MKCGGGTFPKFCCILKQNFWGPPPHLGDAYLPDNASDQSFPGSFHNCLKVEVKPKKKDIKK